MKETAIKKEDKNMQWKDIAKEVGVREKRKKKDIHRVKYYECRKEIAKTRNGRILCNQARAMKKNN